MHHENLCVRYGWSVASDKPNENFYVGWATTGDDAKLTGPQAFNIISNFDFNFLIWNAPEIEPEAAVYSPVYDAPQPLCLSMQYAMHGADLGNYFLLFSVNQRNYTQSKLATLQERYFLFSLNSPDLKDVVIRQIFVKARLRVFSEAWSQC